MNQSRPVHISGYARVSQDYYPTPAWVTTCLLRHVSFRGRVWEPCCGDGAIATELAAHQYLVTASDLEDRGFGTPGIDFFTCDAYPPGCGAMVTNPPYDGGGGGAAHKTSSTSSGMLQFVRHALDLTIANKGQLALLVRFQWMAGKRAAALLQDGTLDQVVVLTRRIQWFDNGEKTNIAQHHHAWVVFDAQRDRRQSARITFDQ